MTCKSCHAGRPRGDVDDADICIECREDAESAELLFRGTESITGACAAETFLRALAGELDDQLPFTPYGFAVLSRKVLGLLGIVHRDLDVARVSDVMEQDSHADHNAGALAATIRGQLQWPSRKIAAIAARRRARAAGAR